MTRIRAGAWRDDSTGPMQVVSGPIGKERVHFEAPPAARLDAEMTAFLDWFNADADMDPVLKAGLAHLWFVTIHPFDDGNGRIARAIADMALARSENSPQRFYSMSAQIRQERNAYYDILEETQKGTLDITPWMEWFLGCLGRAIDGAQTTLAAVLAKARFWEAVAGVDDQRPSALGPQPPAGWLRGQAHDIEIRQARQVLPGHGASGHSAARRTRHPRPQSRRRAQHELCTRSHRPRVISAAALCSAEPESRERLHEASGCRKPRTGARADSIP